MSGTEGNQNSQKPALNVGAHTGTGKGKRKNERHGESRTILYRKWATMKSRCMNKNNQGYVYYGGKGVIVCPEWAKSFSAFKKWAIKNNYKEGLEIDRILSSGNYEPSNCRFVTHSKNVKNAWRIANIYQAALFTMKDKPLYWITPKKENIPENIYTELFNSGMCNKRINPHDKNVFQYQLKNKR